MNFIKRLIRQKKTFRALNDLELISDYYIEISIKISNKIIAVILKRTRQLEIFQSRDKNIYLCKKSSSHIVILLKHYNDINRISKNRFAGHTR